jgi:hypothetical protein
MATVFWHSHKILLMDYLEKSKSITGVYYASLLDNLKAEIATKDRISAFEEEESFVAPRQRPCSHLGSCYVQNSRITVRIDWPPTIFSRSGPESLFYIS